MVCHPSAHEQASPFNTSTGYFVRIAENEVSVSHPDAVRQLLHANIAKVYSINLIILIIY